MSSPHCVDEHPVLFPKNERLDGALRRGVVNRHVPVGQEHFELFLLIDAAVKPIRCFPRGRTVPSFARDDIGKMKVSKIKKSDVKRFYNKLADDRGMKASTVDSVHTVLHQIFEMAVDDDYIRSNPTNNVLRELKQSRCFETEKRRGLTMQEQELFLDFL